MTPLQLWRFHEAPAHVREILPAPAASDSWLAVVFPDQSTNWIDELIARWGAHGWSVERHAALIGVVLVVSRLSREEEGS